MQRSSSYFFTTSSSTARAAEAAAGTTVCGWEVEAAGESALAALRPPSDFAACNHFILTEGRNPILKLLE